MNYYDSTGNLNRYTAASDGAETLDQSSDRIGSEMDNAVGVARRADFASEMQIRQTRVNNRDNQRTDRIGKSIACRLAAARRVRLAMTRQSKQITQLDGSNEGILYDRAGQALQMPPDVEGDWSQYYRLVWDAWGRLVEVKDGSLATVASYGYDGTTRRITKTVDGTTVHCYYNERWKAIEEREGSSTDASRQYLWGARPNHRDELVRAERDTTAGGTLDERLYCLMDYYDPIAMTDPTGDVVERYEFSAFGLRSVMDAAWTPLADTAHAVEFAFHGQFLDTETGYYDYGYRYYSPQIGRWLSKDPIGESGGANLYFIVANDLLNGNDYLGLQSEGEPTLGYTTVISPPEYTTPDGEAPTCGWGRWQIQWNLSAATKKGGYVVQHVTMESSVKDCQGNDITKERYRKLTYSEAWSVYPNRVGPTFSNIVDDTFYWPGTDNCTEGWFQISGVAEFVPVTNLPPQFSIVRGVREAGGLLSTEPAMAVPGGTGQINRKFRIEWNCCAQSDSPSKYSFEPPNA